MAYLRPSATRLLRPAVADLTPYAAPEPMEEFARSLGVAPEEILKLDQNENPYGCSPRVPTALAAFPWYHVYPDPEHRVLRERLGEYAGVDPAAIVVGNGSDELIELLLRLFVEPGDRVVSAGPTFGYYATAAAVAGAEYVLAPRGPRFEILPETIEEVLNRRAKLVFIASPNNPTGNATPIATIERLLAHGVVVVADEAYFEFAGQTALPLLRDGADNLVVLRTFSKWAGLAGLRLGYGIFPRAFQQVVAAAKPPYSVNQAAEVAGLASLDDLAHLRSTVARILAERERLELALAKTGLLAPYPSDANFLLCEATDHAAADLQNELARRAILVRRYDSPRLENCLRISVGRPEQNDRLLAALAEIGR